MKNSATKSNSATSTHKTFSRGPRTIVALIIAMSLFCLSTHNSSAGFTLPGIGKLWFYIPR